MDEGFEDHLDLSSLDRILDLAQPDINLIVHHVTTLLEDSPMEPAFAQGWFQPGNKYSVRLEEKLAGLRLGEAANAFLYRNETRKLYGDHVILPRKQETEPSTTSEATVPEGTLGTSPAEKLEEKTSAPKDRQHQEADRRNRHQKQEEDRRNRHRSCQHDSHERCPEIAAECGAEHAKKDKLTRTQEGKGPGKDEQLFSSIYTQEMAARLVQALNERHKRDQNVIRFLLELLQRQHNPSLTTLDSPPDQYEVSQRTSPSIPSYVGMKRGREEVEVDERRIWTRVRQDSDATDARISSHTDCDGRWR